MPLHRSDEANMTARDKREISSQTSSERKLNVHMSLGLAICIRLCSVNQVDPVFEGDFDDVLQAHAQEV